MNQLISVLIASALFFGFLLLTAYESRKGVRFFPAFRYKLDTRVARTQFLIEHIDWGAFTAHLTRTSLNTIAHDAAHGTLIIVRSAERNLTQAVSALRTRREGLPTPKNGTFLSETVRPMSDIVRKEGEN